MFSTKISLVTVSVNGFWVTTIRHSHGIPCLEIGFWSSDHRRQNHWAKGAIFRCAIWLPHEWWQLDANQAEVKPLSEARTEKACSAHRAAVVSSFAALVPVKTVKNVSSDPKTICWPVFEVLFAGICSKTNCMIIAKCVFDPKSTHGLRQNST